MKKQDENNIELITYEVTDEFIEIEIEEKFFFWKRRKKYREVLGDVFRYKDNDRYFTIHFNEYMKVKYLFKSIKEGRLP